MTHTNWIDAQIEHSLPESTHNDTESVTARELIRRSATLTPAAQAEFRAAYSLEFALDGEVYLGTTRHAHVNYPHLAAEAAAAGITTVTR